MGVLIYGASDDLIEIEGDIREEFNVTDAHEPHYLALSDGTFLEVEYRGIWRFRLLAASHGRVQITAAPLGDEENYTDKVNIDQLIGWAVFGEQFAVRLSSSNTEDRS